MKYPKSLPADGTIGFVAPSYGAGTEPYVSRFKSALEFFQNKGYKQDLGPNVYANDGIGISSTPESCGAELTDYYCSDTNSALLSLGGGELMCEILDYIDWDRVKQSEPKWYSGYSDNTNFTFLLSTLCDTAALYGPCAPAFGIKPMHSSLSDALGIITGTVRSVSSYPLWEKTETDNADPLAPYNCTEPYNHTIYSSPYVKADSLSFSGRLLGGCLDCLVNLSGTCYDKVSDFNKKYADDGIIWFIESCDLTTMDFRRAMWRLKHTGWFDNAAGFIFGRPYFYDDCSFGLQWEDAMLDAIKDLNVPIIRNADIGHLPPMLPIISGAKADIIADVNSLTINYTESF